VPTPTYVPLATQTLTAQISTVTFSSIPATYRDLILFTTAAQAGINGAFCRFNTDYRQQTTLMSDAGGPGSTTVTRQSGIYLLNLTMQTNSDQVTRNFTQIMDYSATDKHKTHLTEADTQAQNLVTAEAQRFEVGKHSMR
jgi:hypothetical protein